MEKKHVCAFCGQTDWTGIFRSFDVKDHDFYICLECEHVDRDYLGMDDVRKMKIIVERNWLDDEEMAQAKEICGLLEKEKEGMRYGTVLADKRCPRCDVPMVYYGSKDFQNGTYSWLIGSHDLLWSGSTELHMTVCPECSLVEFYMKKPELRTEAAGTENEIKDR